MTTPLTVFDILEYGASDLALGTVNRAAIVAAIAAASPVGGQVWIPPIGTYAVDVTAGPIAVPPGVTIRGSSARYRASRITHYGGGILFDLDGGFETRRISGIVIRGGALGSVGIRVRASGTKLDHITFDRYTGAAGIHFVNGDGPDADGPWLCRADNIDVECLETTPGTGSGLDYGIRCGAKWNGSSITNSSASGCKKAGIYIEGGAGSQIRNVAVGENDVGEADTVGILVTAGTALMIDGIESEGNYSAGLRVVSVDGLVVTGFYDNPNGYRRCAPYSIDIQGGTSITVIGGGPFNSAATAGIRVTGGAGVSLLGVPTNATVSGAIGVRLDNSALSLNGPAAITGKATLSAGARSITGNTGTIQHGAWTTIFNPVSVCGTLGAGMFLVMANHLDSADGKATTTILADRTYASERGTSNAAVQLRLDGSNNVQVQQNYGVAQNVQWGYLFVPIT